MKRKSSGFVRFVNGAQTELVVNLRVDGVRILLLKLCLCVIQQNLDVYRPTRLTGEMQRRVAARVQIVRTHARYQILERCGSLAHGRVVNWPASAAIRDVEVLGDREKRFEVLDVRVDARAMNGSDLIVGERFFRAHNSSQLTLEFLISVGFEDLDVNTVESVHGRVEANHVSSQVSMTVE